MSYLDYIKNKKVVIPGGNGFLGQHIVKKLKDSKCKIFVPRTKEGIDFRRKEDCNAYLSKIKPHIVINCAAIQGGIGYHGGKQADLLLDNTLMGFFLMHASQMHGVEKFVNVVAGCSYPGYLDKEVMNEEDYWSGILHNSIFSYGFARKASVVYGLALKKQHNFNSIHLIMANMYGPGEHFNSEQSKALAALIKKIYEAQRNGDPFVEIWGTGKAIRDWMYVEDGAEAVLRSVAEYDKVEPLNIATGVGISVTELAEIIKEIIGYKGEFRYDTTKADGALHKTFGVSKMKKVLRWLPQTKMKEGIKKTVTWFEKNYDYAIAH